MYSKALAKKQREKKKWNYSTRYLIYILIGTLDFCYLVYLSLSFLLHNYLIPICWHHHFLFRRCSYDTLRPFILCVFIFFISSSLSAPLNNYPLPLSRSARAFLYWVWHHFAYTSNAVVNVEKGNTITSVLMSLYDTSYRTSNAFIWLIEPFF